MGQAMPKQKQIPKPIPKSDKSQKFKWFKVPASQLVGLHQIESLDGARLPKGGTVEGSCENKYLPARRREKNATKSAQNLNTRHAKLCQLVAATAAPHCTTAPPSGLAQSVDACAATNLRFIFDFFVFQTVAVFGLQIGQLNADCFFGR